MTTVGRVSLLQLFWICAVTCVAQSPTPTAPQANEDHEWTMPAKNFQNTRFSGLDQIKIDNAKDLRVAWTFSTGVNRGQEAAPIVVGDTMFIVTPYPNIVYALDLRNNGAVKWKFEPQPAAAAQGVACCDVVIAAARSTKEKFSSTPWTITPSRSTPRAGNNSGIPK